MTAQQMLALRGAFVYLKTDANQHRNAANALRQEAIHEDAKAKRLEGMAAAASSAFVELGGDPEEAKNWWSWSYKSPS